MISLLNNIKTPIMFAIMIALSTIIIVQSHQLTESTKTLMECQGGVIAAKLIKIEEQSRVDELQKKLILKAHADKKTTKAIMEEIIPADCEKGKEWIIGKAVQFNWNNNIP